MPHLTQNNFVPMGFRQLTAAQSVFAAFLFSQLNCTAICRGEDDSIRVLELLRGAAAERSRFQSITAEMTLKSIATETGETSFYSHFIVEQDGGRRRFESLADAGQPSVYISGGETGDEDLVYGFLRGDHSDLDVCTKKFAATRRGIFAFDPRIVGLTSIHASDVTVDACLWLELKTTFEIVGTEEINGVGTTHVKLTSNNVTGEYWISEPGYRVHRRKVQWGGEDFMLVKPEYDANDPKTPFPKRVFIFDCQNKNRQHHILEVLKLDLDAKIAPERFAIGTIDLPVNTMINDYRINRITGYWNGSGISKDPVPVR